MSQGIRKGWVKFLEYENKSFGQGQNQKSWTEAKFKVGIVTGFDKQTQQPIFDDVPCRVKDNDLVLHLQNQGLCDGDQVNLTGLWKPWSFVNKEGKKITGATFMVYSLGWIFKNPQDQPRNNGGGGGQQQQNGGGSYGGGQHGGGQGYSGVGQGGYSSNGPQGGGYAGGQQQQHGNGGSHYQGGGAAHQGGQANQNQGQSGNGQMSNYNQSYNNAANDNDVPF